MGEKKQPFTALRDCLRHGSIIFMTMPPPLSDEFFATLPIAAQVYLRQFKAFATQLSARIGVLTEQVAQLEAKLKQNSSNSSRPPSSDGPRHKRGVPRPPRPLPRDGQTGHSKHERVILPPSPPAHHRSQAVTLRTL